MRKAIFFNAKKGECMNYLISRIENLKIGDVGGVGKEQERNQYYIEHYYKNPDFDKTRTQRNITLVHDAERDGKTWERYVKDFKDEHNIQGRCNFRNDNRGTNIATSFFVGASKEYMDNLTEREQVAFYKDAMDSLKEIFPTYHWVEATIHRDETTPHLHVIALPLYYDNEKSITTFNTSKTQGGKYWFRDFQDKMFELMKNRGHDINRGIKGSEREHLTVKQFKEMQDLEREKQRLFEKPVPAHGLLGYKYKKEDVDRLAEDRASLIVKFEKEQERTKELEREKSHLAYDKARAIEAINKEHDARVELLDKLEDKEYLKEHLKELEHEQEHAPTLNR